MANASRHAMGPGSQGKGSGSGGLSDEADGLLGENDVLSNRDRSRHGEARGLDSKSVQAEQRQDSVMNRDDAGPDTTVRKGHTTGLGGPMSTTSSDESSVTNRG